MIKDCTTLEQGRLLIQLGIDKNTADKCWIAVESGEEKPTLYSLSLEQARENRMTADKFLTDIAKKNNPDVLTPSWSLTALLAVINERFYTTLFHDGVAWNVRVIEHNNPDVVECNYDDSPITACVKLIFQLKQKKLF